MFALQSKLLTENAHIWEPPKKSERLAKPRGALLFKPTASRNTERPNPPYRTQALVRELSKTPPLSNTQSEKEHIKKPKFMDILR